MKYSKLKTYNKLLKSFKLNTIFDETTVEGVESYYRILFYLLRTKIKSQERIDDNLWEK